ncbi:ATP-dependent Clp protease ATP-binding subunit [Patescibacteria group bacterium]|nr:ATP-dependent Clp protease ATP-binding subunit [Patescibacteria group bacterium]
MTKEVKENSSKFSSNFNRICFFAYFYAKNNGREYIVPLDLFISLILTKDTLANSILKNFNINEKTLNIENIKIPTVSKFLLDKKYFSMEARNILDNSILIATCYEHYYVGTEHLLYSILKSKDKELKSFFGKNNIKHNEISKNLIGVFKSVSNFLETSDVEMQDYYKRETNTIDYFSLDLTDPEVQKDIDPVINRDKEIERLIYILSRRYKNNPILLGEAGVGKTAIVEGLAKKIMQGDIPDVLFGTRILSLDINSMIAGASFRGEFENRLKDIIDEASDSSVILFIDEIHSIVGSGANSGNQDTANILKPALSKGNVRFIGATTYDEYRQFIEKDSALERRFQPVFINEPTEKETLELVKNLKNYYESFHNVKISDDALKASVNLSARYINNKNFPDKALDLLDEASSRVRIKNSKKSINREIATLYKNLDDLRDKRAFYIDNEDFNKVLEIKYEEDSVKTKINSLTKSSKSKKILGEVKLEDVAEIVSSISGVPIENILLMDFGTRIKLLEKDLKSNIIGQEKVINDVVLGIKRGIVGINNKNKPLSSFLFVGPSGSGKTETAKILAKSFFGKDDSLVRFDMSEYSEAIGITSLIGAPAGYVGFREGGKLTDSVKRNPYSVVLFDEIEKAHPKILNLLLQVLDDGYIIDALGKKISFKNNIIIMTSSLGIDEVSETTDIGFPVLDEEKNKKDKKIELINDLSKDYFSPEFLNRIDKISIFNELSSSEIKNIVKLNLEKLKNKIYKEKNITVNYSVKVVDFLTKESLKLNKGGRSVLVVISDYVEDVIVNSIISDSSKKELNIRVNNKKLKIY